MRDRNFKRRQLGRRVIKHKQTYPQKVRLERLSFMKTCLMAVVLGGYGLAANRALKFVTDGFTHDELLVFIISAGFGSLAFICILAIIIPEMERLK